MTDMDEEPELGDSEEEQLFGETEDDLADLSNDATFDAMVVAMDWTTETLLSQITRGNLELDPIFQRRDAWNRQKKSRFIESIIVGLPVPQVVLAERQGKRGEYIVLDGKQRLLSIQQFMRGDFRLYGLDLRGDLNRLSYEQLPDADRLALDTQTVRTVVVRNWKREEFLYLVFLRLNTASVPLSPQELRQALHPGEFVRFVNEFTADNTEFASLLRRKQGPDFRMRDVELLVRYFAFMWFLPSYRGNLKELLDYTCRSLNERMEAEGQDSILAEAKESLLAIMTINLVFGAGAFRRWNGKEYERPFNRAVFDVMIFYARIPEVRKAILNRGDLVEPAFKRACESARFAQSITVTTKSVDAVYDRLTIWGAELAQSLDMDLLIPVRTEGGRIAYP